MQLHPPTVPRPAAPETEPSPIDVSDEALTAAGMVKVAAFVRGARPPQTKRASKHRQRYAKAGLRQVNVIAPESAHATIKAFAEQVRTGCDVRTALQHVLASEGPVSTGDTSIQFTKRRPTRSTNLQRLLTRLRGFGATLRAAAQRLLDRGIAR